MSDFDNASYSANGGGSDNARAEVRSMPFFPAPPGAPAKPPAGPRSPAIPLGAPTPVPPAPAPAGPAQPGPHGKHSQADQPDVSPAEALEGGADAGDSVFSEPRIVRPPSEPVPVVKGRIKIEDEVVEKIAALAVLDVPGVAALGGDAARVIKSEHGRMGAGDRRGGEGVKVRVKESEVSLDVTIVVEYGSVVMDVARTAKNNVARIVSITLGMRVTEVNVTVDDVRLPGETVGGLVEADSAHQGTGTGRAPS